MRKPITEGWVVALAALGINLILGLLYSWSLIQKALVDEWGWTNTEASLPYTVCLVIFSIVMIFAGKAQDTYGTRPVAFFGGILVGTGLILSTLALDPFIMMITFGAITGTGIGLGFSAGTPCAIKWFRPEQKGLIAGIVVSGIGLSPVYMAPLTEIFLRNYGIANTFLIIGIFSLAGISLLSLILRNPPSGHATAAPKRESPLMPLNDYTWQEMLRSKTFIILWTSFLMGSAAGLMLIGHLANIASVQAGWQAGFILVVILSVFNALGRIVAGSLSDITGRTNALLIVFSIQAFNMLLFSFYQGIPSLIAGSVIAGLAYGALFALFPAATADFFGLRNLGVNYGLIFTGFGTAGIVGPIMGGMVADFTGKYTYSFLLAALMLLAGIFLIRHLKSPGH